MPKYSEKLFECDGNERLFDVMMPIKDSFIWAEHFIGPFEVNERLKTHQTVQGAIRTYFWCVCVCAMVGHDLPPAKSTWKFSGFDEEMSFDASMQKLNINFIFEQDVALDSPANITTSTNKSFILANWKCWKCWMQNACPSIAARITTATALVCSLSLARVVHGERRI